MPDTTLSAVENLNSAVVHATCVAVDGRGILIIGASGTGKSALGLQMMALGAGLVGDDRVSLRMKNDIVEADAAPNIGGLIEARGIGLLQANPVGPVALHYVVDLDRPEPARLPEHATVLALRQTVPLLQAAAVPNLAAALMQLLKVGRTGLKWPNE